MSDDAVAQTNIYDPIEPSGRYRLRLLPSDPWQHPMAQSCTECGAWVADPQAHNRWHDDGPEVGLSAKQLFAAADHIRGQWRAPELSQPVDSYLTNRAMHGLADALVHATDARDRADNLLRKTGAEP